MKWIRRPARPVLSLSYDLRGATDALPTLQGPPDDRRSPAQRYRLLPELPRRLAGPRRARQDPGALGHHDAGPGRLRGSAPPALLRSAARLRPAAPARRLAATRRRR